VGDVVELFKGPVARLYRRSLEDQGFEVLMMTVFDIAARRGYRAARKIVTDLGAAPNMPLPKAWLCVLRHLGPTDLKNFLAPDEEARWQEAVEAKVSEANERELAPEVMEEVLAQVLAESRSSAADANLRRWLRLIEE
jgi:hypothetical protein